MPSVTAGLTCARVRRSNDIFTGPLSHKRSLAAQCRLYTPEMSGFVVLQMIFRIHHSFYLHSSSN